MKKLFNSESFILLLVIIGIIIAGCSTLPDNNTPPAPLLDFQNGQFFELK